jgi:hypothetical protein
LRSSSLNPAMPARGLRSPEDAPPKHKGSFFANRACRDHGLPEKHGEPAGVMEPEGQGIVQRPGIMVSLFFRGDDIRRDLAQGWSLIQALVWRNSIFHSRPLVFLSPTRYSEKHTRKCNMCSSKCNVCVACNGHFIVG